MVKAFSFWTSLILNSTLFQLQGENNNKKLVSNQQILFNITDVYNIKTSDEFLEMIEEEFWQTKDSLELVKLAWINLNLQNCAVILFKIFYILSFNV